MEELYVTVVSVNLGALKNTSLSAERPLNLFVFILFLLRAPWLASFLVCHLVSSYFMI